MIKVLGRSPDLPLLVNTYPWAPSSFWLRMVGACEMRASGAAGFQRESTRTDTCLQCQPGWYTPVSGRVDLRGRCVFC